MDPLKNFKFITGEVSEEKAFAWLKFLQLQNFDFGLIKEIDFLTGPPKIFDMNGNKFCIDFAEDRRNYHKKKSTMKKELIGRALGAGRAGLRVLDLSAGLAIDAVFLAQLGFEVTALERNPLIFLALNEGHLTFSEELKLKFQFASAELILQNLSEDFDVIYFDPMFPEKVKSALPRQEMVFFRNLVGSDSDAAQVLQLALQQKSVRRVVVKRPIKAPFLLKKPHSQIVGKLVRFDIYGITS